MRLGRFGLPTFWLATRRSTGLTYSRDLAKPVEKSAQKPMQRADPQPDDHRDEQHDEAP